MKNGGLLGFLHLLSAIVIGVSMILAASAMPRYDDTAVLLRLDEIWSNVQRSADARTKQLNGMTEAIVLNHTTLSSQMEAQTTSTIKAIRDNRCPCVK